MSRRGQNFHPSCADADTNNHSQASRVWIAGQTRPWAWSVFPEVPGDPRPIRPPAGVTCWERKIAAAHYALHCDIRTEDSREAKSQKRWTFPPQERQGFIEW